MRVLHIHSSWELYGSDRSLVRSVRATAEAGYGSIVVLPADGQLIPRLEAAGAEVKVLPIAVLRRRDLRFPRVLLLLARWVYCEVRMLNLVGQVQFVHLNTSAVLSGRIAAVLRQRPVIQHVREIIERPRMLARAWAKWVEVGSLKILAVSSATRNNLRELGTRDSRLVVLPNGVDVERFAVDSVEGSRLRAEVDFLAQADVVALCLGRLHPWKGQDLLVSALELLKATGRLPRGFRCVLLGGVAAGNEGMTEAMADRIERAGLRGVVVLGGEVAEPATWLWAADMSIVPSTQPDPLPTTVLESMAARLPVVATRHGGCLDMIEHDRTGLLVDWRTPDELADAIAMLSQDAALRDRLGSAAVRAVHRDFSYERYAERWGQLLHSCHDGAAHV